MEADILEIFANNDKFNSNLQEILLNLIKSNDDIKSELNDVKNKYLNIKKVKYIFQFVDKFIHCYFEKCID